MAMFPREPPETGYAALPATKTIQSGNGPGAIEFEVPEKIGKADNPIYTGLKWLGNYFGWVTSYEKKERGHKPPPRPEKEGAKPGGEKAGAYSRDGVYVDPRISAFARQNVISDFYKTTERNLLANMAEHGYRQIELPGYKILRKGRELRLKRPERDGVEAGLNTYVNENLYGLDGARVKSHEPLGKHLRLVYGVPHDERTDNVIRPLEIPMVMAYARGEKNVLNRFAERAMEELRMAA